MSHSRRDFLGSSLFAAGLWIMGGRHSHADATNPKPEWPKNPFLQGNFGPVHEEVTAEDLPVVGKIPSELDGMFVRNGPNPQFPPLGNYHWFDGDGMLHGVRIRDGKASYRNRYVRTDGWKEEKEASKAVYYGFLDPPDLKRLATGKPPFKNTANTALVWHNGKLLALWEGGPPHEIKVPSLDTIGPYQFGGKLKHAFTAHPKVDLTTREMLCFGYNPVAKPYVLYTVVNAQGQIVRTTPIDIPKPVMMHDCAVTQRHTLFLDLPEIFDFSQKRKDVLLS
jgi:carotenoid cleavage dioxygenase